VNESLGLDKARSRWPLVIAVLLGVSVLILVLVVSAPMIRRERGATFSSVAEAQRPAGSLPSLLWHTNPGLVIEDMDCSFDGMQLAIATPKALILTEGSTGRQSRSIHLQASPRRVRFGAGGILVELGDPWQGEPSTKKPIWAFIRSGASEPSWVRPFESRAESAAVTFGDGSSLYLGVGNEVVSIDCADGTVRWRRGMGRPVEAICALADSVCVSSGGNPFDEVHGVERSKGRITKLSSKDGSPIWNFGIPSENSVNALVADRRNVYLGDLAYVPSGPPYKSGDIVSWPKPYLRALDLGSGKQIWKVDVNEVSDSNRAAFDGLHRILLADGTLYCLEWSNTFRAVSIQGSVLWTLRCGYCSTFVKTGQWLVLGSGSYHGKEDNGLFAVNAMDGKRIWSHATLPEDEGGQVAALVCGGDRFFAMCCPGTFTWKKPAKHHLYAFEVKH